MNLRNKNLDPNNGGLAVTQKNASHFRDLNGTKRHWGLIERRRRRQVWKLECKDKQFFFKQESFVRDGFESRPDQAKQ